MEGCDARMTGTRGLRRGRRIIASVLVVVLFAGAIVTDQIGIGKRDGRYQSSPAYAYLAETIECLSYGWLHWIVYRLGAQFSNEDSASGRYRRACVSVANEDFAKAEEWMDAYIETEEPGRAAEESASLFMQLACIRSLNGDAYGAVQAAHEAVTQDGENAHLQQLLYQFSLEAGDTRGAAKALGTYAALTEDDTYYEEIADLYLEAGDYEESGRFYDLAIENDGETDRLLYMRGTCSMLSGRYAEALEDFAASAMPGSLYSQGVCAMALNDLGQAEVCFLKTIDRGEQANDARLMLAVCRLESGEPAAAESLLDQYLAAGGSYEDIAYYRASARAMQENYIGAAEDYDAAVQAGSFRPESLFAAAQCYYFAGNYTRAIERFEQCVDEEIELAQSWYYLGLSLMASGETERAAEALDHALDAGATNG